MLQRRYWTGERRVGDRAGNSLHANHNTHTVTVRKLKDRLTVKE